MDEYDIDDEPNLGPCCICEGTEGVRNGIMLPYRGPTPGHGWGCIVCRLPSDGAVAVLCDDCLAGYLECGTPLRFACRGYPATEGRVPMRELVEHFDHDPLIDHDK